MINQIGYISGLLLGWCGLPQVLDAIRNGHTNGVSRVFIWMWFSGEIGMVIYTILKIGFDKPLILNYTINIIMLVILIKYTYRPRK